MYKTTYVCDCCGKEMTLPMYTLELKTNSLCIQDQVTWHYCGDCWGYIKKGLTKKNELNDLEETVEELKEENKKLKEDANWYQEFWSAMFKAAQKNREKYTHSSPYISYTVDTNNPFSDCGCYIENTNKDSLNYRQTTVSTSGEKTIQAKPVGDGPFTAGCCCESADKDDLDYKQTVGMI